jgi:hypothetical protein
LLREDLQGLRFDSFLSQLNPLEMSEWAMQGIHLRLWVFSIFVPDVPGPLGVEAGPDQEPIVCNDSTCWNVKT